MVFYSYIGIVVQHITIIIATVLASSSIIIRIELLLSTISITKKATLGLGYGQELNSIILISKGSESIPVPSYYKHPVCNKIYPSKASDDDYSYLRLHLFVITK
jgi:hypothetical protein